MGHLVARVGAAPERVLRSDVSARSAFLRSAVNTAIFALGGVFTVALLATAALRTAILDAGGDYSKVQLLLFGVQYTGLLLVLCWPAQAELNSIAQTARDNVVAPPALADDNLAAVTDARTAVDSLLGSTSTPLEGFRTRAALAAPLVTALATSLITAE